MKPKDNGHPIAIGGREGGPFVAVTPAIWASQVSVCSAASGCRTFRSSVGLYLPLCLATCSSFLKSQPKWYLFTELQDSTD